MYYLVLAVLAIHLSSFAVASLSDDDDSFFESNPYAFLGIGAGIGLLVVVVIVVVVVGMKRRKK